MRSELFDPVGSSSAFETALALSHEIYALHEAGRDCSNAMRKLGKVAGRPVHRFEVLAAFGSVHPETFARKVLVNWDALPGDVTRTEMLEMLEHICNATGTEFQVEYWVQCLRLNTGDERISDLIFWPDEYFGREVQEELSAAEILEEALKGRGRGIAV